MTVGGFLVVAVLVSASALAFPADDVPFTELAGNYVSSLGGGCILSLSSDATFALTCPAQPLRIGMASSEDGLIIIPGPSTGGERTLIPPPPSGDPTIGPYVFRDTEALWLEPLRWGSRQYLILDGQMETFCRAISDGEEPRATPLGGQFLRVADYDKPAGKDAPARCGARE